MKPITKHTYNPLKVMLLLWLTFSTVSCIHEELAGGMDNTDKYGSVTINVQMPNQVVTNPMTRAGVADFDRMNDINIIITKTTEASEAIDTQNRCIFFKFANVTEDYEIAPGLKITYTDVETDAGDNIRQFRLNFSEEWLETNGIDPKTCYFYAVANWGKKVTEGLTDPTVRTILNLKAEDHPERPGIVATNVMFGKVMREGKEPIPNDPGWVNRIVYIDLQRTAAMVTLELDGSDLNEGIVIEPTKISLHNVPNYCVLGGNNKITIDEGGVTQTQPKDGAVTSNGEWKDGPSFAQGKKLVGTATLNNSGLGFNDPIRYAATVGSHYTIDETTKALTNPNDLTIYPLFLFENYHGNGFGATGVTEYNQWEKRPQAAAGTSEAQIDAAASSCSYIKVEATYTKYNTTDGSILSRGPVYWRFFLGDDITSNFDVMRNNYYMVTLDLNKEGIGEGNSSWRIETDLKEPDVVGEENMVVGGGGEMFCVEFNKLAQTQNMKVVYNNPNGDKNPAEGTDRADFVYAYAGKGSSYSWMPIHQAIQDNNAKKWYLTGNTTTPGDGDQLWFYVSPFLDFDDPATERTASFSFVDTSDGVLATLTFTQYKPIKITVSDTDVANTGNKDIQDVKRIIERFYDYNFSDDKYPDPFTFYVDRVDRSPMPWGFNGVVLDRNQTSGFENVYHLIDPDRDGESTDAPTDGCKGHWDYAHNYLPTGKGFLDRNTKYIDYTNGSCMMHAAMENNFQRYYPFPPKEVTPDAMLSYDELPPRPQKDNDSSGDLVYGWCVPSIVGWQLLEKMDRYKKSQGETLFDSDHPILEWTSYWTSNTESKDILQYNPDNKGDTRSFVYQFNMGLDAITVEEGGYPGNLLLPRITPLRYRLLNIHPKYLRDDSSIPSTR